MVPRRFEDLPPVACMTLLLFAPVCLAQAPSAHTLAPILAEDDQQALTPLPSASHLVLESVPGSVSSMPSQQYRTGAVISLSDALSRIPGVYAQSSSGQISAKISIRGSGLATSSGLRGIRLLRDGLPLGRADDLGDSIYLDPMGASQIEIYRGASSLQFGAATLGGAINLISPTGYSNPGIELRVEGGPDQYRQTQLRTGAVRDPDLDTFASFTRYRSNGFRQHAQRESNRFYGNIGWRVNPLSAGRLHLTLESYQIQMPGPLSLEQLQKDPRAANPTNLSARTQIHTSPRWHLAYQHEWHTGLADKLSLGLFHTGTKFDSSSTVSIRYDAVDYGMALRHEINREWKDHAYQLVWGASYSGGQSNNRVNTPAYLPGPATQLGAVDARRSTLEVFAENHLQLHPALTLVAGAQASWAKRQTHNSMSALMGALGYPNGNASADYLGVHPKLGVIWAVSRNAQLFANLSRNTEAPHSLVFIPQAASSRPSAHARSKSALAAAGLSSLGRPRSIRARSATNCLKHWWQTAPPFHLWRTMRTPRATGAWSWVCTANGGLVRCPATSRGTWRIPGATCDSGTMHTMATMPCPACLRIWPDSTCSTAILPVFTRVRRLNWPRGGKWIKPIP